MALGFFAIPFALSGTDSVPSFDVMYLCLCFLFLVIKECQKHVVVFFFSLLSCTSKERRPPDSVSHLCLVYNFQCYAERFCSP